MSWMMPCRSAYELLADVCQYPPQSLRQMENDPRVRVCLCGERPDVLEVFSFGAEIDRKRKHWFIFFVRSRLYAIEASTEQEVKRIIEHYRVASPMDPAD